MLLYLQVQLLPRDMRPGIWLVFKNIWMDESTGTEPLGSGEQRSRERPDLLRIPQPACGVWTPMQDGSQIL